MYSAHRASLIELHVVWCTMVLGRRTILMYSAVNHNVTWCTLKLFRALLTFIPLCCVLNNLQRIHMFSICVITFLCGFPGTFFYFVFFSGISSLHAINTSEWNVMKLNSGGIAKSKAPPCYNTSILMSECSIVGFNNKRINLSIHRKIIRICHVLQQFLPLPIH
jgi:hypothetical protein